VNRSAAAAVCAVLLLASCTAGTTTAHPSHPAAGVPGGLTGGLIGFRSSQGIGVLDPASGKSMIVVPLAATPYFRVIGPVWGPAASGRGEALYFTLHDLRTPETPRSQGIVAYDWLFRADPFSGRLEPLAASPDASTDGPVSLAASRSDLAFTTGCCGDYDVDVVGFGKTPQAPARIPRAVGEQGYVVEAASPVTGWFVLQNADGTWEWLDPRSQRAEAFPYPLQPQDGPVAISADDRLAAVAGARVQLGDARSGGQLRPLEGVAGTPAALAWSPSSSRLALALGGGVEVVAVADKAGAPASLLPGAGVTGIAWSDPLGSVTFASVKAVPPPQGTVDALLAATALPAADDSVSGRARTKVYLWRYDLKQAGAAASPVATVTSAGAAFLSSHPPLAATVLWHHWAAGEWLLGGCYRYRAIVAGATSSLASTISLGDPGVC
jgi:hypothetical protein